MPAAALLLAALTACSPSTTTPPAETTAAQTAEPSGTATPTADPAPDATTAPERPASMDTPSADAAAAAGQYFTELTNYAFTTSDFEEWDALAADGCITCNALRSEGPSDDDGAGPLIVASATGIEIDPGRWYSATLDVSQTNADGKSTDEFQFLFALSYDGDWAIEALDVNERER